MKKYKPISAKQLMKVWRKGFLPNPRITPPPGFFSLLHRGKSKK